MSRSFVLENVIVHIFKKPFQWDYDYPTAKLDWLLAVS